LFVCHQMTRVINGFEGRQRIPHVRMLVMRSVPHTSIKNAVHLPFLIEIPLEADQELASVSENRLVLRFACCQEGHDGDRGVVGNQI
jgi:hypothetical protein